MNWLTNFVRPKIRALVDKKEIPDNLWVKCGSCETMLFGRDLHENLNVCNNCGYHMPIKVDERLESVFDNGEYKEINLPEIIADPLKFKDKKRYTERLKEYRSRTGREDAIVVAQGKLAVLTL